MEKKFFQKMLCCLAIVLLLSGCAGKEKSPLLAHADDDTGHTKFAELWLYRRLGYSIENAEGETLQFVSDPESPDKSVKAEGNLDYYALDPVDDSYKIFLSLFSKSFTVQNDYVGTALEEGLITEKELEEDTNVLFTNSHIVYYLEDGTVVSQAAGGKYDKAVHHCNNVIELFGDLSEFCIKFVVLNQDPNYKITENEYYQLDGSGKDHVIVALVDGEIKTEGMVSNYTVYKSVIDKDIHITKEYDETGKLLSTTEEK